VDFLSLLRAMGALGLVLGMLTAALWLVKRYNIRLPGALAGAPVKRVALIERTGIDARRSVALIRRDGREHLILLAPEGHLIIESGIIRDEIDAAAAAAQAAEMEARAAAAQAAALQAQQNMKAMLSNVAERSAQVRRKVSAAAGATVRPPQPAQSFDSMVASAVENSGRPRRKSRAAPAAPAEPVLQPLPQAQPRIVLLAAALDAAFARARPRIALAASAAAARSAELRQSIVTTAGAAKRAWLAQRDRIAAQAGQAQERLIPPTPAVSVPAPRRRAPVRLKVTDHAGNIVACGAARG
jgi:flagellar biogenesis protein FliO